MRSFSCETRSYTEAGDIYWTVPMPLMQLLILALIQGVTEFLPISSSGHLILLPNLTGMEDQGQVIDVAVHVGTLFAVILYFWADVKVAAAGTLRLVTGRVDTPGARLAFLLLVATIPVIVFGLALKISGFDDMLRSVAVIGWTMLVFGIVLYWADMRGAQTKGEGDWTMRDAIVMGVWQATITAARYLGYNRHDGAKLAMLMSIPTIIASGVVLGAEVVTTADAQAARDGAIAAVFAFVAALGALALMMRLLRSVSFTPYVIYRVVLGVILLWIAYS